MSGRGVRGAYEEGLVWICFALHFHHESIASLRQWANSSSIPGSFPVFVSADFPRLCLNRSSLRALD